MSLTTPSQYCFPYFFNEQEFKKDIEQFGLQYKIEFNKEKGVYMPLQLFDNNGFELTVEYFFCLMIDLNNNLIIWHTDEDELFISKLSLIERQVNRLDFKIDLHKYEIGKYELEENYNLSYFITYVRKGNIKYDLDYYERFAIVIIEKETMNIIPFDWFNKSGGDYGYVWPAVAQLNVDKYELIGKGMRMADFKIQL